jgi:hypothetical protein
MTTFPASCPDMHLHADLVVFSSDDKPLVIVEVKGGKDTSPQSLEQVKQQLLTYATHIPAQYLLAVFRSGLFLWEKQDEQNHAPRHASARSLFREYASSVAEPEDRLRTDGLRILVHAWLDDLAIGIRKPKADSEADQLLVDTGIYEKMKRGRVATEVAL